MHRLQVPFKHKKKKKKAVWFSVQTVVSFSIRPVLLVSMKHNPSSTRKRWSEINSEALKWQKVFSLGPDYNYMHLESTETRVLQKNKK